MRKRGKDQNVYKATVTVLGLGLFVERKDEKPKVEKKKSKKAENMMKALVSRENGGGEEKLEGEGGSEKADD